MSYYTIFTPVPEEPKIVNLPELEALIRASGIMRECTLFKELGIFSNDRKERDDKDDNKKLKPVKEFLLNLVEINHFLGRKTLIDNAKKQFSQVTDFQVEQLIQQLCHENKIQLLDPKAKPEAQLICFVPKASLVKK